MGRLIDSEILCEELKSNLDLTRKYTIQELFDRIYECIDNVPSVYEWKRQGTEPPEKSGRYLVQPFKGNPIAMYYSKRHNRYSFISDLDDVTWDTARHLVVPVVAWCKIPRLPTKFRRLIK